MSEQNETPKLNVKVPPTQTAANVEQGEGTYQTQGQIDREESLLRMQAEKLRVKRELMEIKKLEYDIAKIEQENQLSQVSHEQVESVIADTKRETEGQQSACNHMKGGASESFQPGQVVMGNDATNYCLIDHTLSSGVRFRLCQRCGKTWFPKDFDYKWAMSRPSKNTRSIAAGGPALVRFRDKDRGPRMESEIPHRSQPIQDFDVSTVPGVVGPGPAGY